MSAGHSNFEHAALHLASRLTLEPTPAELVDACDLLLRLIVERSQAVKALQRIATDQPSPTLVPAWVRETALAGLPPNAAVSSVVREGEE